MKDINGKKISKEMKGMISAMDALTDTKKAQSARAKADKTGKPVTYKEHGIEVTMF